MIDLHCHSSFSDGEFKPDILLKKANEIGLTYFSITDHNNCFAYEKIDTSKFSGKLIRGVEIVTSFKKHIVEILGYGMQIEEINEWSRENRKKELEYARNVYEKLIDIFETKNISYTRNYNFNLIMSDGGTTGKVKQYFYKDLLKYRENVKIIGEETLLSYSNFNKKGLNNPNSILFISEYTRFLELEDAVDLIHRNHGLCFLAHAYQYNIKNHINFLDDICNNVKIDGLEVYHSSFSKKQIREISEYADKNNLYKSGGSDYHGKLKPNIKLGHDLQISEELIKPWINKIMI